MAQPRQFIDSVKEALDLEYGFNLQKEVPLPKGQGFFFDLADIVNAAVVEIRPGSDVDDIEFTSVRFPPNSGEAEQMFGEDLRYFLVYETDMDFNDKSRLESILEDNMKGRLTVLDMSDIYGSAGQSSQQYESNQPLGNSSKFSEEKDDAAKISEDFLDDELIKKKEPEEAYSTKVTSFRDGPLHAERVFYAAATKFDGNELAEQFISEGIWENFTEIERFAEYINGVAVGSVIFLRGTDDQKNMNHLFIKQGGIVTANPQNGRSLSVNWILKDFAYNITEAYPYWDPLTEIGTPDIYKVLEYFSLEQLSTITLNVQSITKPPSQTIAGLISDADSGKDYLDITKDVAAFSRVIAAKSFIPPLAIALFGKWGSGKSFFMRKLREQIDSLADQETNDIFCSGIAQVHFNAWSYLDSNLWASMVSKIFEGLQEYISQDTLAKVEKETVEKSLIGKLNSSNERIAILQNEKQVANAKLSALRKKKRKIKYLLKAKLKRIGKDKLVEALKKADELFHIDERITEAITSNKDFVKNKERFREIVPEQYWKTPEQLYERTRSLSTFLKVFFDPKKWWKNILWMLLIIAVIIVVPLAVSFIAKWFGAADMSLPKNAWAIITVLGGLGVKGINVYNKMQPLVDSFWKIKKEYEVKMAEAKVNFEKEQQELAREIEMLTTAISEVEDEISETLSEKAEIEFRLKHTLSSEAMYSFIERRSESEEYSKHLGIISVIRKDFEILSELFTDHNSELQTVNTKDTKLFYKLFERPLERIILYIDDLDRCPEERVVEVLEAVNLLMAFPLFIVVVGVDPRWVKNALYKRHQLQFSEAAQNGEMELISPSAYLEKIFQVPFNLKSASDKSVKHMLKTLASAQPRITHAEVPPEIDETSIGDKTTALSDNNAPTKEGEEGTKPNISGLEPSEGQEPTSEVAAVVSEPKVEISIESLTFSEDELKLIQGMSEIIGSSPRAIKRFVNIFRIVKAHEDYPNTLTMNETNAVLFLLALPIGKYKRVYETFIQFMSRNEKEEMLVFFNNYPNTIEDHKIKKTISELNQKMTSSQSTLLNAKLSIFSRHYPLIKRFSYISQ